MNWKTYGDVNPIEHGGIWIKKDNDIEGRCFYLIELNKYDDHNDVWRLLIGYVDLDDKWIQWDSVNGYNGVFAYENDEDKVVSVIHYYGNHISNNGEYKDIKGYRNVVEFLKEQGITDFKYDGCEYLKDSIKVSTSLVRREIYVFDLNDKLMFSLQEAEENEFEDVLNSDEEAKDYVLKNYENEIQDILTQTA